jgi:hypothetical protein
MMLTRVLLCAAPPGPSVRFTPCFDWVVQATGSSATALAYGVIWRYAQMRGQRCYASCTRLSAELGWSRQRIMRHLRTLLDHGLVTCLNPQAVGAPREYLPVPQEVWSACCDSQQVTPQHTPCNETSQEPVTLCDTNYTNRDTKKRPEGQNPAGLPAPGPSGAAQRSRSKADPRTRSPAIQAVRQVTGHYPAKALYDEISAALGATPDVERLRQCYRAWCARGYNPHSLAWLLEWYAAGRIPAQGPAAPGGNAQRDTTRLDPVTPDEFARWRLYQESVQKGEDPDEAKRRLGL